MSEKITIPNEDEVWLQFRLGYDTLVFTHKHYPDCVRFIRADLTEAIGKGVGTLLKTEGDIIAKQDALIKELVDALEVSNHFIIASDNIELSEVTKESVIEKADQALAHGKEMMG